MLLRKRFQSTPSPRRETHYNRYNTYKDKISIHSLPKEGDDDVTGKLTVALAISIHSLPKEGDHLILSGFKHISNFNPLPPQGGRQIVMVCNYNDEVISIHSLPKEGDLSEQ